MKTEIFIFAVIIVSFLIGWFGGIAAYKYGLKNNPTMLPPKSKYEKFRNNEI